MATKTRSGNAGINNRNTIKKNAKRKNLFNGIQEEVQPIIPEIISSQHLQETTEFVGNSELNSTTITSFNQHENKDMVENNNNLKQEEWGQTDDCIRNNNTITVINKIFQRKKGRKYGYLLPGEVGNLNRYIRKELFFRMKFVTDNMFDKFKILDQCFEQINLSNPEDKRLKEKSIIKVVKDAINSRRGYACQLLTEKLKGKKGALFWVKFITY
jgi:hypothetical protein